MNIIEDQHPGEPYWLYWLGNATAIDPEAVRSIGLAWLFKEFGRWDFLPCMTGEQSLFFNAVFFLRVTFVWCIPAGIFASVRWSDSTTKKALFQVGAGYKLNGRLAVLCRIQSDEASAKGVTGPNFGQATGFDFGTH